MILIKILKKLCKPKTTVSTNRKLRKTLQILRSIKNNEQTKYLNQIRNIKIKNTVTLNPIAYILNISTSRTNTLINLTDSKGQTLIANSGGSINLKKKQKRVQPLALLSLLKDFLLKSTFMHNQTIAVHFKNVKPYYESLVIKSLKKLVFIKSIKSSNLQPHNGCRPKKIKRFKRRTKRL